MLMINFYKKKLKKNLSELVLRKIQISDCKFSEIV